MNQPAPLTISEQVTLRRVAHGISEVDFGRRQDLDRLRVLALIDANVRAPRLTVDGKRRYDALPLAVAVMHGRAEPRRLARHGKKVERRPRR